ncbi:hypothetical protein AUP68_11755 [Ilyonectria robusta]
MPRQGTAWSASSRCKKSILPSAQPSPSPRERDRVVDPCRKVYSLRVQGAIFETEGLSSSSTDPVLRPSSYCNQDKIHGRKSEVTPRTPVLCLPRFPRKSSPLLAAYACHGQGMTTCLRSDLSSRDFLTMGDLATPALPTANIHLAAQIVTLSGLKARSCAVSHRRFTASTA